MGGSKKSLGGNVGYGWDQSAAFAAARQGSTKVATLQSATGQKKGQVHTTIYRQGTQGNTEARQIPRKERH